MPKKIVKSKKKTSMTGGNIFTDVINSGQDIINTKDEEYGNREIDWGSIFGGSAELASRYNELQGDGLKEWFFNLKNVILNPRKSLGVVPKPVTEFLSKYGDHRIMSIKVCREPLSSAIISVANKVTANQFDVNKKTLGYDDVFHLYLSLQIMSPKGGQVYTVLLEKNQRVILEIRNKELKAGGSCVPVQFSKIITLNDLVMTDVDENIWIYDAFKRNCQNYVSGRLRAVGLLNDQLSKFINQNVEQLLPNKLLQSLTTGATNIANLFENIWKGGSSLQY